MYRVIQPLQPESPRRHSLCILGELRVAIQERAGRPYTFATTAALVIAVIPNYHVLARDFGTPENVDINLLPILQDILALCDNTMEDKHTRARFTSEFFKLFPSFWEMTLCRKATQLQERSRAGTAP